MDGLDIPFSCVVKTSTLFTCHQRESITKSRSTNLLNFKIVKVFAAHILSIRSHNFRKCSRAVCYLNNGPYRHRSVKIAKWQNRLKSVSDRRLFSWLLDFYAPRFILIVSTSHHFNATCLQFTTMWRIVYGILKIHSEYDKHLHKHTHKQHNAAHKERLTTFVLKVHFSPTVLYNRKKTFPLVFWFWFLSLHLHLTYYSRHSLFLCVCVRFHFAPTRCVLARARIVCCKCTFDSRKEFIHFNVALFVFIFLLNMFISIFTMQMGLSCSNISAHHFFWPNFFSPFLSFIHSRSPHTSKWNVSSEWKTFVFRKALCEHFHLHRFSI